MDHLTFAQLLGNYGEFLGAIAVVVSLFYLAMQIRQAKLETDKKVIASGANITTGAAKRE